MKQEPCTYFREPCAVTREGGREVSVAAHMARDIEQRKMCRAACHSLLAEKVIIGSVLAWVS